MYKNLFCAFLVIFIGFIFGLSLLLAQQETPFRDIREKVTELKRLIQQKKAEGADVSRALELDRRSKEAMREGRPEECLRLLKEAIALLEKGRSQRKNSSGPSDSFFEVHLEPGNANDEVFDALRGLVNLADSYNVKLTILFTPQWAEMVLNDKNKLNLLKQWKQNGHEIGGHHHGPSVCPWDGYTNLQYNSIEFKNRQNRVPCPEFVRKQERYLGDMQDYMELLNKLGRIKTITMSDEDIDWPEGALYSGGGRTFERAISSPEKVVFNGHTVYKLSSAPLKSSRTAFGERISIEEIKREYLSNREGVFGLNAHAVDYKNNPELYKQWFEFLKKQDPTMRHSKTISEIMKNVVKKTETPTSDFEDSPFGIFGPYESKGGSSQIVREELINNYLKDLGVKWVQEMYFTKELRTIPAGINIYSRVGREGGSKPPSTTERYKEELRKVIRKYKHRIKYWEVGTEPSGFPPPMGWQGYEKEYVEHLKATYEIIKEECPDCLVVFGGLPGIGTGFNKNDPAAKFLKKALQAGACKYFDVFEFKQHAYKAEDYKELGNKMRVYGKILAEYGIDIKKIPVFVETAMYDGDPYFPRHSPLRFIDLPPQTESQQAQALIKTYVYALAQGVDKIFWNLIIEWHNFSRNPGSTFNFYGLVNNPDNDGKSHKKLAYYTYKLMVEKLEGSDWNNIETIQESDNVYVYKFTKKETGKPVWVVWWDWWEEPDKTSKTIILNIGDVKKVKITEAVPKYETGKEVTNYETAFNTETKGVKNGKLTLKESPVFIEGGIR